MTPTEKIQAWHDGTRKMNLNACSMDKLKKYRKIALSLNYTNEVDMIDERINKINAGLTRKEVEYYIDHFENEIGDRGEDLFKSVFPDMTGYSWGDEYDNKEDLLADSETILVCDTCLIDNYYNKTYNFAGMTKADLRHILLETIFVC